MDAPELPDTLPPEVQEPQPSAEPQEDTSVPEELSCSDSVAQVIEENQQFAVDCYNKKINAGGKYTVKYMTGKVALKVALEEGKVTSASKFTSDIKSGSFQKCLIDGVKKLEFTEECNEEVTIPFTFPPQEDEDDE